MKRPTIVLAVFCLSGMALAAIALLVARNRDPQRRVRRLIEEAEERIREIERLMRG